MKGKSSLADQTEYILPASFALHLYLHKIPVPIHGMLRASMSHFPDLSSISPTAISTILPTTHHLHTYRTPRERMPNIKLPNSQSPISTSFSLLRPRPNVRLFSCVYNRKSRNL